MKSVLEKKLIFSDCARNLPEIVSKLVSLLHEKGYEISVLPLPDGRQTLKVEKGELLDELIGTKVKVCLDMIPQGNDIGVSVRAGLLKRQIVPTLIMLSCWPVLLAQGYGIYRQWGLEKIIVETIEGFSKNSVPVEEAQVLEYL